MKIPGLRNIVTFSSFKNNIAKDISEYYSNDSIIREMNTYQNYHNYPIEAFYFICSLAFLFWFVGKDFTKDAKEYKLNNLEEYRNVSRCIHVFLIIFTMIFVKNIENAI